MESEISCTLIGPISSVTILGQTIVIVNDVDTAVELLEKRSAKYSSRPKQIFAGEMYVFPRTSDFPLFV